MSGYRSAEEVKRYHIKMMGEPLGSLYHALLNELAWLHTKWREYIELFGTTPSRIDLMNQASGLFFRVVQVSLWEDTILHIARLTDPPISAGKKNLTIKRLPDLIEEMTLKARLSELIDLAVKKADFSRDWRNRHIAHQDLDLALSNGAQPLKSASRAKVKEALSSVTDVLNELSTHYMDSTTLFERISGSGGAVSLLHVLEDGLRADKKRT